MQYWTCVGILDSAKPLPETVNELIDEYLAYKTPGLLESILYFLELDAGRPVRLDEIDFVRRRYDL